MEWMDARSDGNGAMVWTRDTATGETRRGDEPHRTVLFTFGLITLTEPPVIGYVRACAHTHGVRGDGRKPREVVERSRAGQTNRNARTNGRTNARDVGNTEDGGRVKRKE